MSYVLTGRSAPIPAFAELPRLNANFKERIIFRRQFEELD